jgi:hypothetical protein
VEQVVAAEACTTRGPAGNPALLLERGGQRGVRLPIAHCSPAPRTNDREQRTIHHYVQIRSDEGGFGAFHIPSSVRRLNVGCVDGFEWAIVLADDGDLACRLWT